MKKNMFLMLVAAMAMAMNIGQASAQDSTMAGKTTKPETAQVQHKDNAKQDKKGYSTKVTVKGATVNGHPATQQEKETAKKMMKQAGKMVVKAAQIATTAATNPDKAEQLKGQIEQMADEMEQMGDQLEQMEEGMDSLIDDTTYYGAAADDDIEFTDEDLDEVLDEWRSDNSWWKGLLGGGAGIAFGLFGVLIAIVVCLLLFALFTAPIWILLLIIFLIARSGSKKDRTNTYYNTPAGNMPNTAMGRAAAQAQAAAAAAHTAQGNTTTGADANTAATGAAGSQTAGAATGAQAQTAQPGTAQPGMAQPHMAAATAADFDDETQDTWRSGVKQCCLGVGLIIFFVAIGMDALWGIGALVICLGVAKLVIASTSKGKKRHAAAAPQQESFVTGLGNPEPAPDTATPAPNTQADTANTAPTDGYNKQENI